VARDSKGNLYAGGGTNAKLFEIPAGGKGKLLAELDALEIHAIAIDAHDRVYFATAPDGKVYRLNAEGKPEVFYDPKCKYIWALAFDGKGNLFVATGDHGEIHRVAPDGKGQVFFQTDETHVRSMTFDGAGNLIVGTDPGGLVLRVTPAGEGFVLYQMSKREVTSVAVARDGAIYAAGVGNKQGGSAPPPPSVPPPSGSASAASGSAAPGSAPPSGQALRPSVTPPPASSTVTGGSEVYRIEPDGNPRRVWTNPQDLVYAITFDSSGRAVLGTGNKGNIYRIESPTVYTSLLTVPVSQVTSLLTDSAGHFYAATGNVGKVYEIGPDLEREGTLESDVFDSTLYSLWGRLSYEGTLRGGQISIAARSGNLDQPQKNWSKWGQAATTSKGARAHCPGARFVQWKATLTASPKGDSPELDSVDLAYLPKNIEPHVDLIEITPPNYKFPPATLAQFGWMGLQPTLTLPPLGRHGSSSSLSAPSESATVTPSMQFAKGYIGARWLANDPNGDSLVYTVEIRGANETEWKPLKERLSEKYYSWDSTAFPDGDYRIRVTASDAPSNPPAEALTARMVSDNFTIDNTPPRITAMSAARTGGKLHVRWHAADALNNIERAEYSLDGGDWLTAEPVTRLSDSMDLDYDLALDASAGEHTIAVRVYDAYENLATDKTVVK
jgi:sugar lactone lactonase YvrE